MTDVLQADIFFFIASVATIVFLLFVSFILFNIYKIVKLIRSLLERLESASELVAEDAAHIRHLVSSGGVLAGIMSLLKARRRRARSMSEEE